MPVRLTFLIRDLGYGGAQRQLVTLARGLQRADFEISVLHFYPGPLEEELRAAGIVTVCVGKKGRWDLIGFFFRLVRRVRSQKPDIIHGYLAESNLMSVLLKPFVPGARIVWGLRDSQTDAPLWGLLGRLSFCLGRLLSRQADGIIANSAAGRAYYAGQGFPGEKIHVIPNGIDVDRHVPDREAGLRQRSEWGVAPDSFVFGHVGRLNPMKDHPTLLRAMKIVSEKHPQAHLVCIGVGDMDYAAKLRLLAKELGIATRISWIPPGADLTAAYNAFDILVSSSSFGEGFSNVVAEAMACGVPCVVTAVGDSGAIVAEAGCSVPPGQPAALAQAMSRLLETGAAEMRDLRTRAWERIVKNFSIPLLVRRTREVLVQLAGAKETKPLRECLHSNA